MPGLALITIATLAVLAGCSSGSSSSGSVSAAASGAASGHGGSVAAPPAALAPAASSSASAASAAGPESGAGKGAYAAAGTSSGVAGSDDAGGGAAQAASDRSISGDQQLVYTAQLAVRAKNVGAALSTATSIVTAAGGYVSAENTSGAGSGSGAAASQATADVTLKIPAAVYPATLAKLTGAGLGTQLSLQQQAQDVTQQVADVGSLVASDEAAITQLRALLKDAGSVGNLLVVQDQINTETSNLESMLAQQQALDHETAYATVTLTLVGPKAAVKAKAKHKPVPPPGLASGLTGGWRAFRLTVDWLLAIVGAVAPFAAIVVVIAGGVWWVRRRIGRGASAAGELDSNVPPLSSSMHLY
jgi:Domain of unknown function (DUF4349)